MKQKQLSILAASLVAAFAANVASAGQIQSSSSAIAHEVIVNDAQTVAAPPVSYRFAGDVDASLVAQTFQVQLVLPASPAAIKFNSAATANAITLVDNTGTLIPAANYTVTTPALSTDGKVLYANITVKAGSPIYVTPAVRFNDTTVGGSAAATVAGLRTFVGDVKSCENGVPTLGISFKHFANVTSTSQADDVTNINSANEHKRFGSTNDGTLFTFPTNISVKLAAASTNLARVDASTQNTKFRASGAAVAPATDGFVSTTVANLGTVTLSQDANGSDSGSNAVYSLTPVGTPASAGITTPAAAVANNNGAVEIKNFNVVVTASQGFALNSTVWLSTTPGGIAVGGATATVTATTGNSVTLTSTTLTAAQLQAPLYVVYTVPGTTTIPSSTFSATGTLAKAPDSGTTYLNEQNNSCTKSLASLVGSVKVDVRNYATSKNGGWTSYIRLINPSETNVATVYGQLIHSNGTYGGWGQIATLQPREAKNMSAAVIDPLLTTAPVDNGTGYKAAPDLTITDNGGLGERLRISAEGVSALKVQNYLLNGSNGNFIEASSAQGVDFDVNSDRALDAQLNDQDAQRNIAK